MHSFSQHHLPALLDPPAAQASANTAWEQPFVSGADRVSYLLITGAITENVTMKLTQATTSGGSGAKDITGATTVAVTASTDNAINEVEIGPGALDDAGGFTYVRAEVTVAAAASELWCVVRILHRLRNPGNMDHSATFATPVRVYT